ncbi:hypothetical protein [Sphingomonas sp.]|uniref:hypothetical protein n=1 Tax=Sphingomonas sp. TaxID=28214 RepID=UPI00325FD9CF
MGIFPLFAVAVALLSATPAVAALTAPEKRIIATVEAERAAILMRPVGKRARGKTLKSVQMNRRPFAAAV